MYRGIPDSGKGRAVWEWKYWDVAIAIGGFLVQCGLAYLGLTMTHWKNKAQFLVLVLIGLVFTGFAVKRGVDSAEKVQAQLDAITRNTEHPANITVNPPAVVIPPRIPPKAKVQFSFLPLGAHELLVDTVSRSIDKGIVAVAFTAKNVGAAQANKGQIWIQLAMVVSLRRSPRGQQHHKAIP